MTIRHGMPMRGAVTHQDVVGEYLTSVFSAVSFARTILGRSPPPESEDIGWLGPVLIGVILFCVLALSAFLCYKCCADEEGDQEDGYQASMGSMRSLELTSTMPNSRPGGFEASRADSLFRSGSFSGVGSFQCVSDASSPNKWSGTKLVEKDEIPGAMPSHWTSSPSAGGDSRCSFSGVGCFGSGQVQHAGSIGSMPSHWGGTTSTSDNFGAVPPGPSHWGGAASGGGGGFGAVGPAHWGDATSVGAGLPPGPPGPRPPNPLSQKHLPSELAKALKAPDAKEHLKPLKSALSKGPKKKKVVVMAVPDTQEIEAENEGGEGRVRFQSEFNETVSYVPEEPEPPRKSEIPDYMLLAPLTREAPLPRDPKERKPAPGKDI